MQNIWKFLWTWAWGTEASRQMDAHCSRIRAFFLLYFCFFNTNNIILTHQATFENKHKSLKTSTCHLIISYGKAGETDTKYGLYSKIVQSLR